MVLVQVATAHVIVQDDTKGSKDKEDIFKKLGDSIQFERTL